MLQFRIFGLMAIATVLCLSSCDSRGDAVIEQPAVESELLQELSAFNQSVSFTPTKNSDSYYWQGTTPKRLTKRQLANIVVADVGGAYTGGRIGARVGTYVGVLTGTTITGSLVGATVGALGGAAFASWRVAPELPDDEINESGFLDEQTSYFCDSNSPFFHKYLSKYETIVNLSKNIEEEEIVDEIVIDDETLEEVNLDNDVLSIGLMHNVILALLYGDIDIEDEDKDSQKFQTKGVINYYQSIEEMILDSPEMEESLANIDYDNLLADKSLPSYVISLYSEVLGDYPDNCDDVVYLINNYHSIIENSTELTAEEKNWINIGLAVSMYSYNYWNCKLN